MDLVEFERNPLVNVVVRSPFAKNSAERNFSLGIDEAGRGPVLGKSTDRRTNVFSPRSPSRAGPMVYSAFFCDEKQMSILKDLGCAGGVDRSTRRERTKSIFRFETIDRRETIEYLRRLSAARKPFGLRGESSLSARHFHVHVEKVRKTTDRTSLIFSVVVAEKNTI